MNYDYSLSKRTHMDLLFQLLLLFQKLVKTLDELQPTNCLEALEMKTHVLALACS